MCVTASRGWILQSYREPSHVYSSQVLELSTQGRSLKTKADSLQPFKLRIQGNVQNEMLSQEVSGLDNRFEALFFQLLTQVSSISGGCVSSTLLVQYLAPFLRPLFSWAVI